MRSTSAPTPQAVPIVFVVEDDVSVRESLELLSRCTSWQAETFASAREFLSRPRALAPSCLVLDVGLPDLSRPGEHGGETPPVIGYGVAGAGLELPLRVPYLPVVTALPPDRTPNAHTRPRRSQRASAE